MAQMRNVIYCIVSIVHPSHYQYVILQYGWYTTSVISEQIIGKYCTGNMMPIEVCIQMWTLAILRGLLD